MQVIFAVIADGLDDARVKPYTNDLDLIFYRPGIR